MRHIRNEYSTFRWLLEPMLVPGGFEVGAADFRGPAVRCEHWELVRRRQTFAKP